MRLTKIIKEILPPIVLRLLIKFRLSPRIITNNNKFFCPVCRTNISYFDRLPDNYIGMLDKYQNILPFFNFETLYFLRYLCPVCSSSDRYRLYADYFTKRFEALKKPDIVVTFLDIAPDKEFTLWLKQHYFINYRSVDLLMDGVDDKADITDLNIYESEKFDIILCSHVLEHVLNDNKALSELYRVLKKGGWGIIMVPILLTLESDFENPHYKSIEDRWKYFGQNDHVRVYSKNGFLTKLEKTGFKVNQLGIEYFTREVFEKHGIHPRSVLYIVEK